MTASGYIGWDHPDTARYYEAFCQRHERYRAANRELVRRAELETGHHIIDLGAGTGRTAEAALERLVGGSVLCVEPAAAMRAVGQARLSSPLVSWSSDLPTSGSYDRILCGASIWLMLPLADALHALGRLLAPGGALCFNIPSLYLGQPDPPGGGEDPLLLALPAMLPPVLPPPVAAGEPLPTAGEIDAILIGAGLEPSRWELLLRLTQAAYHDWLKIPVTTDVRLRGLSASERAACIDRAFEKTDSGSWRWERWTGWTAWLASPRSSSGPHGPVLTKVVHGE